jgi:hypothetical protein
MTSFERHIFWSGVPAGKYGVSLETDLYKLIVAVTDTEFLAYYFVTGSNSQTTETTIVGAGDFFAVLP